MVVYSIVVGDFGLCVIEMGLLVLCVYCDKVVGYVFDDVLVVFWGMVLVGCGFWFLLIVFIFKCGDCIVIDEIFGLVVVVLMFDDEVDVISLVNDIVYGLFGLIWIDDLFCVLWVVWVVEFGNLLVNLYLLVCFNILFGGFK